ncbi:putative nuclear protein DGCR14/ESS-2 [Helianthus anomalus]
MLRYEFLLEGENRDNGLKRDRITDEYGTSDQPLATLDGWKYTAKNLLMYHSADRGEVALTQEERANRLKAMTKEISKTNTRFHGRWWITGRKKMMKWRFVKTPSPAPGVDESPFVTWGEIEGTPLRLEPEDTPVDISGSGNKSQFNIPLPPSRDVKAHSLSGEASRKIRDRSRMFQKPPLSSGCASPGARTLSPATQKFVRNAIAKSSHSAGVDESLRASYRGSSLVFSTPKGGRSASRLSSRSPSLQEGSNPQVCCFDFTLTVCVSLNVEAYNF